MSASAVFLQDDTLSSMHSSAFPNDVTSAEKPRPRVRRGREADTSDLHDPSHQFAAIGVRKSVGLTHMRTDAIPKLSLIHRRAVNVLLSVAQRIDRSGEANDGMYSIDLPTLERLCGFKDDSNRKYMIGLIRQIVGLRFEFFEGHSIHVGSVIAEIEVCFKTRTMRYSLPVGMRSKLLHPERFSHMKLVLLNMFTSYSALTLYELVSSSFTHPARRTQAYPWQQLSTWLTGSTTPHSTYREFSKLLGRAIEQVNSICPTHTIELMFTKQGRATSDLWFQIRDRLQATLSLEQESVLVSSRLSASVATLSLKASDLEELSLAHGEDYLISHAELVVKRIQKAPGGAIAYPRAYFLKAVSENWANVPREYTLPKESSPGSTTVRRQVSLDEARQLWWEEKNATYRQKLADATDEEKASLCESLHDTMRGLSPALYEAFKKTGLSRPFAAAAAVSALARRDWNEPSEAELIAYAKTVTAS